MVFIEDLSTDANSNNVNKITEDITVFITEPKENEASTAEQPATTNSPSSGAQEAVPLRFAVYDNYEVATPSNWPVQVPLPWKFASLRVTVCLHCKSSA